MTPQGLKHMCRGSCSDKAPSLASRVWFAVRLQEKHELLRGCTRLCCPRTAQGIGSELALETRKGVPGAHLLKLHITLDLHLARNKQRSTLDSSACWVVSCLILGYICRLPMRHLEFWTVTAVGFQCSPDSNFSEYEIFISLAYLWFLISG